MRVNTDPATSATLYNGELKVIIPAIDLTAITRLLQLPSRLARYVCARSRQNDGFDILRISGKAGSSRVPVPSPPTFCLGMLATSNSGMHELDTLREVWSGGGDGFLPRPVLIDPAAQGEPALAAHSALFDAAAAIASSSAARLLSLHSQFCAFRITHEQLQNAFDTIEAFLSRANLPSTWLAFACEPADATLVPPDTSGTFRVSQRLPLPSQGLAAIELHAMPTDEAADGTLNIAIATCEDGRSLGDWAIPYNVVPQGWIFLDLPEIDIGPRQTTMLSAVWTTRSGRAPGLSLTSWQPEPEGRYRIDGGEAGERSLALRLHVGLPGSRRISHPLHIGVLRHKPFGSPGARLAPSVLRRFTEIASATQSEPLVQFLEETEAIELRAVNGTMTVAKLSGALPPKTHRLSATIRTEDPTASIVEYALLALGPDDSHEPILRDGLVYAPRGGFSGWLPVKAEFATQIHVDLPDPSAKALDLYLAIRLVAGEIAHAARTRWLEFVVDDVPKAMPT